MPISGGDVGGSNNFPTYLKTKVREGIKLGFTEEEATKLSAMYGSNVDKLYEIAKSDGAQAKKAGLPLDVFVKVLYAMREEMTATPADFFIRRTGALFFDIAWVEKWKTKVLDLMAKELVWGREQKEKNRIILERHLHDAVRAVDEEQGLDQKISNKIS